MADDLVQHEELYVSLLCEQRRLKELLQQRIARADELSRAGAVRTVLLFAEHHSPPGGSTAAIAALRNRSRMLTARLEELEEELEALLSSRGEVLEARQRATVAADRRAALSDRLRQRPTDDAERQQQLLDHEESALREAGQAAATELETAAEAENWANIRQIVDSLMDATEGARRAIVGLERACETQAAARRSASSEAAAAAKARSEPLRAELQGLQAQVQALRRSLSDDERRRLEAGARARQEESRLRADVEATRRDVERLKGTREELSKAVSEMRQEQAKMTSAAAAAAQEATAPAASAAAPAAAKAAAGATVRLGRAPAASKSSRLDPEQRQRLEKLQAKYGSHVAQRAAGKVQESK